MTRVLVTGATGNVGRHLVGELLGRGMSVRAAGLSVGRIRRKLGDRVDAAQLDFRDPTTFPRAVSGCDAVFLLRPPELSDTAQTLNPFIDVARAGGARHVVFVSVAGAADNRFMPHHAVEQHLMGAGPDYTLLRSGIFSQNFGDAYWRDIVERDRVYVPAGRAHVAFVDVRDVAEVAARVLSQPGDHRGQAYTLTGPATVDFTHAARVLSEATGRAIVYEPASIVGYARHLQRQGASLARTAVQTVLHVGLRFGHASTVDPTLERLLGRPGRTLAQYMRDHRSLWARGHGDSAPARQTLDPHAVAPLDERRIDPKGNLEAAAYVGEG